MYDKTKLQLELRVKSLI